MSKKKKGKEIGLAVIGCGTIGRIRAVLARDYPGVGWIGLCDIKEDIGKKLADDIDADFFTTDYVELINRPEVTATIIATDENLHFGPTMAAIEQGHDLFIEKPLAESVAEAESIVAKARSTNKKLVIGYILRHHPSWIKFIEIAQTLGKPLVMRMNLNQQ